MATLLCQDLPGRFIREDWDHNPYLADSYSGQASTRLPSQVFFLQSRARQLAAETWPQDGTFVSDYGFCQDRIFARQRLDDADFRTYESLAASVAQAVHAPDVIVHLDAGVDTLLERIRLRARDFESVMDEAFLAAMRQEYCRVVAGARCPVVAVDAGAEDFRQPAVRRTLVARVRAALAS